MLGLCAVPDQRLSADLHRRQQLALGYLIFRWRKRGKRGEQAFEPLVRRMRQALERGATQSQCSRTAATCDNLLGLWPALWGFLRHEEVPPTNNSAEQALRAVVLKRKISGPTRSRRGDEFIGRGFSAAESCRRQGRDLLEYLHKSCRRQGRDLLEYLHKTVLAWIDDTEGRA